MRKVILEGGMTGWQGRKSAPMMRRFWGFVSLYHAYRSPEPSKWSHRQPETGCMKRESVRKPAVTRSAACTAQKRESEGNCAPHRRMASEGSLRGFPLIAVRRGSLRVSLISAVWRKKLSALETPRRAHALRSKGIVRLYFTEP